MSSVRSVLLLGGRAGWDPPRFVAIPSQGPNHARAHLLLIPVLVQSLFVLICVLFLLWNLLLVDLVILSSTFEACDSAPRGSPYIRSIFEEVIFFWDISFSSLEQDFFFFFHFCLD